MEQARILVVDDDPDNRAMIGHFLSNWGYEVDYANNGKLALKKVREQTPQLVLLDLAMPEMDGVETCERLKADSATEHIPIVIFTGLEQMPQRESSLREVADDYVVKTAEPRELRSRIDAVLERARKYASISPPSVHEIDVSETTSSAPPKVAPAPPSLCVTLSSVPFPEAIRQALSLGEDGIVEMTDGDRRGTVHVSDGVIVHAHAQAEQGEDAFYALALWMDGRFEFRASTPGDEHTIQTPTRSLLVEASRRSDAWRLISTKVPSFDWIPRCVPLTSTAKIRLSKSDWAVIRRADGRRSIAKVVAEMDTDFFEAGRVIFNLVTIGMLRLDSPEDADDDALEQVPMRRETPNVDEPFELTTEQWELLSRIDSQRTLRSIRDAMNLDATAFMHTVTGLKDRGFLRLVTPSPDRRSRS